VIVFVKAEVFNKVQWPISLTSTIESTFAIMPRPAAKKFGANQKPT
jgi:hypothetical protein